VVGLVTIQLERMVLTLFLVQSLQQVAGVAAPYRLLAQLEVPAAAAAALEMLVALAQLDKETTVVRLLVIFFPLVAAAAAVLGPWGLVAVLRATVGMVYLHQLTALQHLGLAVAAVLGVVPLPVLVEMVEEELDVIDLMLRQLAVQQTLAAAAAAAMRPLIRLKAAAPASSL
jgi:hypothetical protein